MAKDKKPFYKSCWFWVAIVIFFIVGLAGMSGDENGSDSTVTSTPTESSSENNSTEDVASLPEQTVEKEESDIPAEYRSALNKASTYANTMNMSKKGVYNQLTSEYGEKFSAEAAQYAIDNVISDWNENALAKARTYQDEMSMSPAAIHDQLTSDYGEKFTQEEADYAIEHLND